ncbi:MAG TPA: hypothetical protein VNT51_07655 [Miltoncostaeaceae bacterium]|nr:hypothetical protein [Miltoncostaeaceae bacterium]
MTDPVDRLADLLREALAGAPADDPAARRAAAQRLVDADLAGLVGGAPDADRVTEELRAAEDAYRRQGGGDDRAAFMAQHLHRALRPAGYS